jgi:hypothetical protein
MKLVAQNPSGGLAQQAVRDIGPPPYESCFAKFNPRMTEEIYNDLDNDNKIDFIQVYINGDKA